MGLFDKKTTVPPGVAECEDGAVLCIYCGTKLG